MNHRHHGVLAVTCIVLLALSACTRPVREAEPEPRPSSPVTDQILEFENNPTLAKHVELQRVVRDDNSLPLRVQFDIINQSNKPFDFMYRVRWFDASAIHVQSAAARWIPRTIQGKERLSLQSTAPTPEAIDYRLVLREWDR